MIKQLLSVAFIVAAVHGCQVPDEESAAPHRAAPAELAAAIPEPAQPIVAPPATSNAPPAKPAVAQPLSFIGAHGRDFVDESGKTVRLRGCNIGCWLLIEPWMISAEDEDKYPTEKDLWDTVEHRFGAQAKLELIKGFRTQFFNEDDVQHIADLGLNCVRVPFWWRSITDPAYGGDMKYLDRCIEWCARRGIYVILDLHGAPGGQSKNATILGEGSEGGLLWTNDVAKRQTVDLWKQLATRFKDQPAVAGYDLINEPMDAPWDALMDLYDQLYKAIREVDGRHLIIMEDGYLGFHRFPKPKSMGWSNIVYSFHYYPQTTEEGIAAALTVIPRFNRAAIDYDVPVYVGEFNSIMSDRGGSDAFLRMCEVFDYYGWAWTFWSYKKVETSRDSNWGVYGLMDPMFQPNFTTDRFEDLTQSVAHFNSSALRADALLEAALREPFRWSNPEPAKPDVMVVDLRNAMVLPGAKGTMKTEWSQEKPNVCYWLYGDTVTWAVDIPSDGVYELAAAISSEVDDCPLQFWVDGVHAGIVKLHGTGAWHRYIRRSMASLGLKAGHHVIDVGLGERGSGLNMRGAELKRANDAPMSYDESMIWLRPTDAQPLPEKSPIRIEWLADPPHFGFWTSGEKVSWKIHLATGGSYQVTVAYATPTKGTHFKLTLNGQPAAEKDFPDTGDWSKFGTADLGKMQLPPGDHVIEASWTTPEAFGAGNMREIRLLKQAQP